MRPGATPAPPAQALLSTTVSFLLPKHKILCWDRSFLFGERHPHSRGVRVVFLIIIPLTDNRMRMWHAAPNLCRHRR